MFLLLNNSNQFYDVELRRKAVLSKAVEIERDRIKLNQINNPSFRSSDKYVCQPKDTLQLVFFTPRAY